MTRSLIVAALGICLVPSAWPGEIVLFDNLQNGYGGGFWQISAEQSVANPFESTGTGWLSEVRLALHPIDTRSQGPVFYHVSITNAVAGLPGPAVLYEWTNVQGAGLNVLTFESRVPVHAGGSYFVKVAPVNDWMVGEWALNLAGDYGPMAFSSMGRWYMYESLRGAMTVKAITEDSVPAVPGPAAAIPFALGLLARRRCRR
ncbi:MAG: hypothetical protein WHU10_05095 [Fimbriimonadales bacterium]